MSKNPEIKRVEKCTRFCRPHVNVHLSYCPNFVRRAHQSPETDSSWKTTDDLGTMHPDTFALIYEGGNSGFCE